MEPIVYGRKYYVSTPTKRLSSSNVWRVVWINNGRRVILSRVHLTAKSAKLEGEDYVSKHGGSFTLRQL